MNRTTWHLTLVIASLISCGSAFGQANCNIRPGDEVWLISARGVADCCVSDLPCMRLCDGIWQQSCCADLFAANDNQPQCTPVIFVHGYQTGLGDAQLRGLQVYQNLFSCCQPDHPIRYVIWAWRSERESRRILKEFTEKAQDAMRLGNAFADTLNRLQSKPPTIIAYSLGAQVSLSALVQSGVYAGAPVQLAVIAAATDCGFSGCCLQMQNCGHISKSYVFCNRCDIAIRAARLSCRLANGKRQEKFEQIAPMFPGQLGDVCIIDITQVASRQHSVVRYTSLPVVKSCINELVAMTSGLPCLSATTGTGQLIEQNSSPSQANLNSSPDICVMR